MEKTITVKQLKESIKRTFDDFKQTLENNIAHNQHPNFIDHKRDFHCAFHGITLVCIRVGLDKELTPFIGELSEEIASMQWPKNESEG